MGTLFGLKAFAVAILGGITSAWGVMLAGLLFGVVEALITSLLGSTYTQILTFALVIVSVVALALERPWETATPDVAGWFSVVWLGIFGSGLAYVLYFRLLGRWGATRTSLVAYLLPVYGIVLGFLVLREHVDVTLILGTALVIAGVALVNSPWGQRRLFGPAARVPPVETA